MTRSIYLVGGAGSGKSTLMRKLLEDWTPGPYVRLAPKEMFGHYMLNDDLELAVHMGRIRPEYPGTDALARSASPHAVGWLETLNPRVSLVLGEGFRLGTFKFLQPLSVYTDLLVVHLVVSDEVAAQRRAERPGNALPDTWCRTMVSAARNATQRCADIGVRTLELDASKKVEELACALLEHGVR